MDWLRRNLWFAIGLLLCGAAVATEAWWLYQARLEVRRGEIALAQRRDELAWLVRQSPALSEETSAAIAADVAAARTRLAGLRQALRGRGRWETKPPARPTDAYFALAAFAEKMRALAARQQVELRPDEWFGFATYANVGPEPDLIAAVHRQRLVVDHVVELVLEAQPRALLAVQRERPVGAAQRRQPAGGAAAVQSDGGVAADFFQPGEALRLRVPGLVETEAFRVEFTGQTQTLRAFLNGLANFRLPLVVRSVEVVALAPAVRAPETTTAGSSALEAVPLVADNFSKFAVTLEIVEVQPEPAPTSS